MGCKIVCIIYHYLMKKKNLIGQTFNKLTIISAAENIPSKKDEDNGRSFTAWNCICECGKQLVVRTCTLLGGKQKTCGCIKSEFGIKLKPGQKFNRLTIISYQKGIWTCLCDCGNLTKVSTNKLTSNNTKSCGCLQVEIGKKNSKFLIKKEKN